MKLLLATRNDAKLAELRRIAGAHGLGGASGATGDIGGASGATGGIGGASGATGGIEVVGLDAVPPFEEAPETGATFEENALAKARDAAQAAGLVAVADDSGLEVDALNGMPGVLSARWSGRGGGRTERDAANLALVLDQLADVGEERRGAAFVCAAAAVHPDGRSEVVVARWRGSLIRSPRGTNGFGYDPAFVPDGQTRTSAEMSAEEKDAVSHRAQALAELVPRLHGLLQ